MSLSVLIVPLTLGQLQLSTMLHLWFDFSESQRDDYVICLEIEFLLVQLNISDF